MTGDLASAAAATVVAGAGVLWFRLILRRWLLAREASFRFGLYALVFLAYFITVMVIARAGQ